MTYIEMFILLFAQLSAAVNLFAGTVQHERIKAIPAASNSKNNKHRAKQEMRFGFASTADFECGVVRENAMQREHDANYVNFNSIANRTDSIP
jgi:hypothetical protein